MPLDGPIVGIEAATSPYRAPAPAIRRSDRGSDAIYRAAAMRLAWCDAVGTNISTAA